MRLFKTRSIAAENCSKERILINESYAKASRTISINDSFSVKNTPIWRNYSVLSIPKTRIGAKSVTEYIIETTPKEELEKLNFIKELNRSNHNIGIKGRPTKKDRRNLDEFLEN